MKALVIYQSKRTNNTKLVIDALAKRHPHFEVVTIKDAMKSALDYNAYDLVVLASGIYFGYPDKNIRKIASTQLSKQQPVFSILTHGSNSDHYKDKWTAALEEMGLNSLGAATCQGHYDFGPFKLVGGMHVGHPNEEEIGRVLDAFDEAINEKL